MRILRPYRKTENRASVLIVVMWMAFGLVGVALYFAHTMDLEMRASDNQVASLQADQAIEAGALYASNILANLGNPNMLPSTNNYVVAKGKVGGGMFWFIGRDTNDSDISHHSDEPSFGLVDEASKANLNAAVYNNYTNLLIDLPQMTANLDAAMYDWQGSNSTPSTGGAKSETYQTMNPPYLCKMAPYETTGELAMVYGMTIDLLYGEDANMNGALDPNENDGMNLPPNDNSDGTLDSGILEYVTVYTHEPTNYGTTNRVLVTSTTALQGFLTTNLSSSQATTIMANFRGRGAGQGAPTSVLDFYNRSAMSDSDFANIEPFLMGPRTVGLINVNTATATALACIPGIGYANAPAVLAYRQANSGQGNSISWLKGALANYGTAAITNAGPWVTSRSFQFTADIAAVGEHGRGYRRVRFVFDCSSGVPQIIYRQDLTYLGWALGKHIHDQLLAGTLK
jgi:type II secretory pathway component PulK